MENLPNTGDETVEIEKDQECDTPSVSFKIKEMLNGIEMINQEGVILKATGIVFRESREADSEEISYTFNQIADLEIYIDEHTRELNAERARGDALQAEVDELKAQLNPISTKKKKATLAEVKTIEARLLKDPYSVNADLVLLAERMSLQTAQRIRLGKHALSTGGFIEDFRKSWRNAAIAQENAG